MEWRLKKFDELNPGELYELLRLRSEVFVVEQNCVFLDMDRKDEAAYHLMGYEKQYLSAYTRLLPAGYYYNEASIGRVVTSPLSRGTGLGKVLMEESIQRLYKLFGKQKIKIGAQLYLKRFYESFGFTQCSNVYLEDGIEHIYMIKEVS